MRIDESIDAICWRRSWQLIRYGARMASKRWDFCWRMEWNRWCSVGGSCLCHEKFSSIYEATATVLFFFPLLTRYKSKSALTKDDDSILLTDISSCRFVSSWLMFDKFQNLWNLDIGRCRLLPRGVCWLVTALKEGLKNLFLANLIRMSQISVSRQNWTTTAMNMILPVRVL